MPDINTDTNQTSKTITPDSATQGVENRETADNGETPDEHVPPVEVPGREESPEHIPEKDYV